MSLNRKEADGSTTQVAGIPYVTKENIGLGKVENKSPKEIVVMSMEALSYVTPEMFGAKGDGTTDDTEALQAAIEYCQINNQHLVLPSKTYLTGQVTINKRINITANGAVLKAKVGTEKVLYVDVDVEYDGTGTSVHNRVDLKAQYKIEGLKVDGSGTAENGIYISQGIKIHWTDIKIDNCTGSGIYIHRATESYFTDITVFGSPQKTTVGLEIATNDATFDNITVIDCYTAFKVSGVNQFSKLHAWIATSSLIDGSCFMYLNKNNTDLTIRADQLYIDTYMYCFMSDSNRQNVMVTNAFVIYNDSIYNAGTTAQPVLLYSKSNTDYSFNMSKFVTSYIQGAGQHKIKMANFTNTYAQISGTCICINTDGIYTRLKPILSDALALDTLNVTSDGINAYVDFYGKLDMTSTQHPYGIVTICKIPAKHKNFTPLGKGMFFDVVIRSSDNVLAEAADITYGCIRTVGQNIEVGIRIPDKYNLSTIYVSGTCAYQSPVFNSQLYADTNV